MSKAADIPSDNAVLCESCGYELTGADPAGVCPECGKPTADSSPTIRQPPPWEDSTFAWMGGWFRTTGRVLLSPRRFFRRLLLPSVGEPDRVPFRPSRVYRRTSHLLTAIILGFASWIHAGKLGLFAGLLEVPKGSIIALVLLATVIYLLLSLSTWLTVRLTSFEARYRGLRLPRDVVARALDYHAIQLLPPAVFGLIVASVYAALDAKDLKLSATADQMLTYWYIGVLGIGVIGSAVYLFITYWAAMKNLMYGNRPSARM